MTGEPVPTVRDLDADECDALLARNTVGRLAYADAHRVEIVPIGYRADGRWLFGRTAPGAKLRALAHRPWVAFEVDEVQGPYDWQSVVARGSFRLLDHEGSDRDRALADRAAELLGLTPDAPVRPVLFAIHVDERSGRSATTQGAPAADMPPTHT